MDFTVCAIITSLLLDDPLSDFVHRADLVAELLHIVLHHGELLRAAPQAPYRVGDGPHRLSHPAQEAWTLSPVRQQILPHAHNRASVICVLVLIQHYMQLDFGD